ncbi:hypothetical protein [Haloarchaeobius litoreus]|uniref:Tat (Twin-arginine translocation) pathway signal sequence n=1 Tax=Haloarchaeobius litoreus TaxID=755306 RepID=A0ABD6DQ54_9EURY|nr:hypothetical protein [Haloarchaeobius litoreus]
MADDDGSRRPTDGDDRTRRDVLRSLGVGAGTLAGLSAATRRALADTGDGLPDSFRVRGTETVTVRIDPEEVSVTRRRVSPDLERRYGRASRALVTTETYPRPEARSDDLPARDTRTIRRPWDTHYATAEEWETYYTERDVSTTEVSGDALARPSDCPKWYFEAVDGGYELKGPMNLAGSNTFIDMDEAVDTLTSNGWTDIVVQYNRYAWVPQNAQFEMQHQTAATGTFRILGGYHAKFWDTGDYVTMTAHEDDAVPHEAISYRTAENEIASVFEDASGVDAITDYYDFENGGDLDHDGFVTDLY